MIILRLFQTSSFIGTQYDETARTYSFFGQISSGIHTHKVFDKGLFKKRPQYGTYLDLSDYHHAVED